MLAISRAQARRVRLPWSALARNKLGEFWIKATGRRIKGQGMIGADPSRVREGFEALSAEGFDDYNLPQVWVERRQIPQVLHGRVPLTGARILDLGCGPGTSTWVICQFGDPSWDVIGFELIAHAVALARERAARGDFLGRDGTRLSPRFECQCLSEPLRIAGKLVPDASVDLALAGGVVGLYLTRAQAESLSDELARTVRPGGFAAIDAGPANPEPILMGIMTHRGFRLEAKARSFIIEPRPKLIFRRT
jgi:SAM-dependent methyltransferase